MRKLCAFLTAVVVCISMAGCGSGKDLTVDVNAMAKDMAEQVSYQDDIVLISRDVADMIYLMPDGIESVAMYMGSGATAEEAAVFEAKDEETAKTVNGDTRQAIGFSGDQTVAVQAVFLRQPVAPCLCLLQTAGEEVNINGFGLVECPDACTDLRRG